MKYAFIDAHRAQYPVPAMCALLEVSRSGYHAWRGRGPSRRECENTRLLAQIRAIHAASGGSYGSPKGEERRSHEPPEGQTDKPGGRRLELDRSIGVLFAIKSVEARCDLLPPCDHLVLQPRSRIGVNRLPHRGTAVPTFQLEFERHAMPPLAHRHCGCDSPRGGAIRVQPQNLTRYEPVRRCRAWRRRHTVRVRTRVRNPTGTPGEAERKEALCFADNHTVPYPVPPGRPPLTESEVASE